MNLLDLLQSASNTAASNVSAPVDALAWLLRKAGVPVPEDAVGGSQWMEQKGLTKPVKQSAESLAGETMGLIGPMAVAAKAPQVAKGLLQMGENAAKPGLLNPQKGAIVWHGSPHKFDKFDSTKIGTGEGAQAYGHGLYLAERPDVAKSYAQAGDASAPVVKNWLAEADHAGVPASQSYEWARNEIAKRLESSKIPKVRQTLSDALSRFDEILSGGNLYKVDLPDDAIAKMLDWDKPLSQQAPEVLEAARKALPPRHVNGRYVDPYRSGATGQALMDQLRTLANAGPAGLRTPEAALKTTGIPGIRYLDGGSRGAGAGTSNFVVFPGEEGLLKILERNGQGL